MKNWLRNLNAFFSLSFSPNTYGIRVGITCVYFFRLLIDIECMYSFIVCFPRVFPLAFGANTKRTFRIVFYIEFMKSEYFFSA